MATVNTKFIANPSFMIASVGKQTITVKWRPRLKVTSPYDSSTTPPTPADGDFIGFCDFPLGIAGVALGSDVFSPLSVSLQPDIKLRGTTSLSDNPTATGTIDIDFDGIANFLQFLMYNPIHCTKLNVRASDVAYLPATMEILTPNAFTGQYDRQIVNILADTNMYQNQSTIVTLDVDFFLSRYSILRVDSNFQVAAKSITPVLAMDFTFDKYLSLEKALVENYQLLQTNAGIENAIVEEVNTINAKTQDVVPAAAMPAMTVPQSQVAFSSPWRRANTPISVQPVTTKGNNF